MATIAFLAVVLPVTAEDPKVEADKLVGVWEVVKSGTAPAGSTMEFTKDGKFKSKFKGQTISFDGKYTLKGNSLTLDPLGFSVPVKELTADKLVVEDLGGKTNTEYKRQGKAGKSDKPETSTAATGKSPPDGWKAVTLEGGRAFVPKAITFHNSSSDGRTVNGVRTSTSSETFSLAGDVELTLAVVIKPAKEGEKDAKPFAPFAAADKKAGGTPSKITDFSGDEVKGRTYTNETKDKLYERKALFQGSDGRIFVLTVSAKDKAKTTNATADTFLKSLSLDTGKASESKSAEPKKKKK
ncbi:hypothetical protein [Limnoglobus roseus]|nr:hypothetical protein [Limnoglobus roseus]